MRAQRIAEPLAALVPAAEALELPPEVAPRPLSFDAGKPISSSPFLAPVATLVEQSSRGADLGAARAEPPRAFAQPTSAAPASQPSALAVSTDLISAQATQDSQALARGPDSVPVEPTVGRQSGRLIGESEMPSIILSDDLETPGLDARRSAVVAEPIDEDSNSNLLAAMLTSPPASAAEPESIPDPRPSFPLSIQVEEPVSESSFEVEPLLNARADVDPLPSSPGPSFSASFDDLPVSREVEAPRSTHTGFEASLTDLPPALANKPDPRIIEAEVVPMDFDFAVDDKPLPVEAPLDLGGAADDKLELARTSDFLDFPAAAPSAGAFSADGDSLVVSGTLATMANPTDELPVVEASTDDKLELATNADFLGMSELNTTGEQWTRRDTSVGLETAEPEEEVLQGVVVEDDPVELPAADDLWPPEPAPAVPTRQQPLAIAAPAALSWKAPAAPPVAVPGAPATALPVAFLGAPGATLPVAVPPAPAAARAGPAPGAQAAPRPVAASAAPAPASGPAGPPMRPQPPRSAGAPAGVGPASPVSAASTRSSPGTASAPAQGQAAAPRPPGPSPAPGSGVPAPASAAAAARPATGAPANRAAPGSLSAPFDAVSPGRDHSLFATPGSLLQPDLGPPIIKGELRVILHTLEGLVKRGVLRDANLGDDTVGLEAQPGALENIPRPRIKAIFFMLPSGQKPVPPTGDKLRVTFKDGRQLAGFSSDHKGTGLGFFVVPADNRTNTERIFIYRSSVEKISLD